MREGHPIALRLRQVGRWDVIPGAEPDEAFAGRVRAGIARIAAAHPGGRVVVVVHGGVIGQALALATGGRPLAFAWADNASISELVVLDEAWTVRSFNDTSHLQQAMTTAPEPLT